MQPEYLALTRVVIAETPRLPQLGSLFRAALPGERRQRIVATVDVATPIGRPD